MWKRRYWLVAGLSALPLLGTHGQGLHTPVAPTRLNLALQDPAHIKHLPLLVAQQLGYFRAEGLDVVFRSVADAVTEPPDLVSGGFALPGPITSGGRPYTAIAMLGRAPQVILAQSTKQAHRVTALHQLRGQTIGVARLGSEHQWIAELVLARSGVQPNEVTFVDWGNPGRLLDALHAGEVDAISLGDPWASWQERRGEIRLLSDTRNLRTTEQLFGGPVPCTCLMASPEVLRDRPAVCQSVSHAVVHALKWLQTASATDVLRIAPDLQAPLDRSLYLDMFSKVRETFAVDGLIPASGPETLVKTFRQSPSSSLVARSTEVPPWTNRFVVRSKALLRA